MPCFVAVLALLSPRVAIFVMFLFTDVLSKSMGSWLMPLIGFFILPWTTLAWAFMWWIGDGQVNGFAIFVVILAFVVDIGSYVGGFSARSNRV
ncbi:MAG: hypothetical protein QOG62_1289 [Thermoleophilaceae bacterium]|jgi:hypothetical protein|nr:hypothetical protein [Thermoleophilaceae bacterium]